MGTKRSVRRRINSAVYRVIRAVRQKLEIHANLAYNGGRKIEIHMSRICDPVAFKERQSHGATVKIPTNQKNYSQRVSNKSKCKNVKQNNDVKCRIITLATIYN